MSFLKNDNFKIYINMSKLDTDILELDIPYKMIQQPYVLNKNIATEIYFDAN
jgi:hypothetical protein